MLRSVAYRVTVQLQQVERQVAHLALGGGGGGGRPAHVARRSTSNSRHRLHVLAASPACTRCEPSSGRLSNSNGRPACTPRGAPLPFSSSLGISRPQQVQQVQQVQHLGHQRRSYIFLNVPETPTELYRTVTTWLADFFGFGPASRQAANPPRVRVAVKLRDRLVGRRVLVAQMAGRGRDRLASARVAARDRYSSQLQSIRERWRLEGRRRFDSIRTRRQQIGVRMNESLQRRRLAVTEGLLLTGSEAKRIRGNATYRYHRAKARVKAKIRARLNMAMRRRQQGIEQQQQPSIGSTSIGGIEQAFTKQVVELDEPANTSWFDSDGYPRTARDPVTGRFVNPWNSESTDGQHSLADIWRWRVEHRLRRSEEDLLPQPPSLSPSSSGVGDCGGDDALEHIRRTIYGETESKEESSIAATARGAVLDPPSSDDSIKLTWLGHSTNLVQMMDFTILTDPMFSNRASALQFVGPARYTKPALRVEELPPVDVVLISHDHYDHLDYNSVLDLIESKKVEHWVVPLGLKVWLVDHTALDPDCIAELEWWQSARFIKDEGCGGVIRLAATEHRFEQNSEEVMGKRNASSSEMIDDGAQAGEHREMLITCTPSQHWSSRTPFDRNRRLWCSFAVRTEETGTRAASSPLNFFFAGDTGLPPNFPLHQQIGDRCGPFDLSAIPIGAYAPSFFMRDSHVDPREAFAIHQAIRSRKSVGIHWGTFALADERYDEPPRLLKKAATEFGAAVGDFVTVRIGGSTESPPPLPAANDGVHDDQYLEG
eukprot:CAMPEP_0181042854 /NCGR_PEP_ID=MMETSP1070-20121207/12382_1 /TAXON_ID=265543 /ORGANISM="Minutocellus polymorphus, Strain NH13" /LENGTH=769 /DNA_ID=CAMNT_0023121115 /DNA_START=36 /DNA_END=2345 /DNA_ORIENTATION=+